MLRQRLGKGLIYKLIDAFIAVDRLFEMYGKHLPLCKRFSKAPAYRIMVDIVNRAPQAQDIKALNGLTSGGIVSIRPFCRSPLLKDLQCICGTVLSQRALFAGIVAYKAIH